jgi:hypothetical protein
MVRKPFQKNTIKICFGIFDWRDRVLWPCTPLLVSPILYYCEMSIHAQRAAVACRHDTNLATYPPT